MPSNFYDLLKYEKTGIAAPSMSNLDKIRALSLAGGYPLSTITGVPPLTFRADGRQLTAWSLLGNSQQTGTPAPDDPIYPQECGDRTTNLLPLTEQTQTINGVTFTTNPTTGTVIINGTPILAQDTIFNCPIPASLSGDFYMSGCPDDGGYRTYDAYVWDITASVRVKKWNGTTQSDSDFGQGNVEIKLIADHTSVLKIRTRYGVQYDNLVFRPMIRVPSASPDFEPYGYKIPVSCSGVTTPIYLGQVQTLRRINKLVLTGGENWKFAPASSGYRFSVGVNDGVQSDTTVGIKSYCSHFKIVGTGQTYTITNSYTISSDFAFVCRIDSSYTLESFKQWLATQYAAGTPVTVWYILTTSTTGIVNEPLCKIGDYVDELHSADAGVTIPTTRGQNVLTVGTDLQPSSVSITGYIKLT